MQVSLNWLNELVDLSDVDENEIAHQLTMSGLEVEGIEKIKPQFTNIITAKIEKIDIHPNADKLHLVTINTGSATKTVVCGGKNIEVGQVIPYASVGSKVLDRKTGEQFELTPAVIRGVESQGMLCSADELGLSDRGYQKEDGILILNRFLKNVELGKNLEDVLGLEEDTVLDLAPTANRGDQVSVVGVARELCALFDKPLKFSPVQPVNDLSTDKFKVEIKDNDVCKYYSIGLLSGINIKPSPMWIQKRLVASGIRAINNVVDITNYVMLEYGTPLHAFDLSKLNGYLCVRRAVDGEKIVTLDEVERTLNTDSVLISTEDKGVCLGGVFGGANSEIDDNSKSIALEAAYFVPSAIRKSARSAGYRSDASARFERGIDIEAVKPALMRAMQLLTELADANVEGVVETGSNEAEKNEITLRFSQVEKVMGCKIEADRCISILEKLGFKLLGKNEIAAKIAVPSFRAIDVTREVDLIEEIARINGYDQIEPTLPSKNESPFISHEEKMLKKIHSTMLSMGLNEIVTSSLIGEPLLKQFGLSYDKEKSVKVENPQSEEFTMLRQTLMANVLQCMKLNYDNGQKDFWAYEIGKKYLIEAPADLKNSGVKETKMLSGIITGNVENSMWQQTGNIDFYTLKGIFENLFKELNLSSRIVYNEIKDVDILHPYRSAEICMLGKPMVKLGFIGQLHPLLKDKMKFKQEAFLFEINIDEVIKAAPEVVTKFKHLPQFPEVQRDLAFVVPQDVTCHDIQKVIKKAVKSNMFKDCDVFDVYQGENIKEGFKSVAFRIKMQDASATLTEDIIDSQMDSVRDCLQKTFKEVTFRA